MLHEDAFLRKIPRIVELALRLKLEVLVNSSDTVGYAIKQLEEKLLFISQLPNFDGAEELRPIISTYCWAIIDQLHAFFQILKKLNRKPRGITDQFLETYGGQISRLRNSMDHIHQNITNLANRKSADYGVYGSISFTTPIRQDQTYSFINFSLGGIQFQEQIGCTIDTHAVPLNNKIGNITFAAFGQNIFLSELVSSLKFTIEKLNEDFENKLVPIIEKIAFEKNLEFEKIMLDNIKGTVYLSFDFIPNDI